MLAAELISPVSVPLTFDLPHITCPSGTLPAGISMDPEESSQPLAPSIHQQHSSEHPAMARYIDLKALHLRKSAVRSQVGNETSFGGPSCPLEEMPPLKERALGLEEVYKRMADNHKFYIDVVREVAACQPSLERADQVLCSMREAAEHEYARLMKQQFGVSLTTGVRQTEENDKEEGDNQNVVRGI